MSYDTGDYDGVERRSDVERMWLDQSIEDMRWVLSTQQGRRVIWEILSKGRLYEFIEGDEGEVNRALGRRELALEVHSWIFTADEKAYSIMGIEADKRAKDKERLLNG